MSYTCLLTHVIFSTKERRNLLQSDELRRDTHAYLGGIARNLEAQALCVEGVSDHVHILLLAPPTLAIADAVRVLKTNSSKWLHERLPEFAWQDGYSAFSVSQSNLERVVKYIEGQEKHHHRQSFQEELLEFLERHKVPYDPRYIWK